MEVSKRHIAEWWSKHPQDYVGWNAPLKVSESALSEYLAKADSALRRDHFDFHDGDRFFSRLIPYSQLVGRRVLEVGCGLGAVSEVLARTGARVVALDLSDFSARATQWRMHCSRLDGQMIQGDAEELPFPSNMFDFVWAWGSIHHTPHTAQAVSEIHRVLVPGGSTCVMVYHRHGSHAYLNILLRYGVLKLGLLRESPKKLLTRYSDGKAFGGCPLAQYFSVNQAKQMFAKFSKVSVTTHGYRAGLVNAFTTRLEVRRLIDTILPERVVRAIMARYGHFLIIQAAK